MTERFDDWSPASVFGATSESGKHRRRPNFRDSYEQQLHQTDGNRLQSDERRAVAPTPPARRKYEDNSASGGGTASLADHVAIPPGRKSRRDSRQLRIGAEAQLAASIQADERNLAASVVQKHARILLLRKREQESLHEVNALRLTLKQAAASLLAQSYRRYRSRHAISAYLSYWRGQESQIQGLLCQVKMKKRKREAENATMKLQRHQSELQARRHSAALLIYQWCAMRVVLRHHRKARATESQRRIACWYRRKRLYQQCQERAKSVRRHQAALAIQQTHRNACHRESERLQRRLAAKKAICDYTQRFLARKKSRKHRLRARSALKIQIFCRQMKKMRDARLELARRRQVYEGVQVLSAIAHRRKFKSAYPKWRAVCESLQRQEQQHQSTSARLVQITIRAFVAHRRRERRHKSAISIQRVFRGYHARQLCHQLRKQRRELGKKQRKRDAATKIQSRIRGFLARLRFSKLMKQLRDRFRCSNCGVIEPSDVYCKFCGRKRTNFDLLMDKRALLLYPGSQPAKKPEDHHKAAGVGGGFCHLAPVRPTSPPSFPKLQASKNGELRAQKTAKEPSLSNNQQEQRPQDLTPPAALEISGLSSLPMVLSPRHATLYEHSASIPAKRPSNRHTTSLLKPTAGTRNSNQAEVQYTITPSRPQFAKPESRAVNQTKLCAQTLTSLQFQQQETSQTHALTQHLHRLQRASHAISRSR